MTAEVAILNREAVAIAADSAATVSDQSGKKIFSSANKIFSLSKNHPVGVMIYGNASFMGIPWETIIKIFRKKLGTTKFDTLHEYSQEFISFLKSEVDLFPESEQEKYAKGCIFGFFNEIKKKLIEQIESIIENKGAITESEIQNLSERIIANYLKKWLSGTCNVSNKAAIEKDLEKKYKKTVNEATKLIFEKIPLTAKAKSDLLKLSLNLFLCFPDGITNAGVSGIVITGFGEKEIFPSVVSFLIEGMACNTLKYKEESQQSVNYENSAIIIPYAQMEMVQTFIDGISPLFNNLYKNLLKNTLDNYPKIIIDSIANDLEDTEKKDLENEIKRISHKNLSKGLEQIDEIQFKHYVEPILKVVTFLPKNELAEMAESLVNLTCLRKKISMDDETVGGPIDVAVISKGDGLIWIRRKHYFEPELNKHFFINYLNK